jgi:hypothetical protein
MKTCSSAKSNRIDRILRERLSNHVLTHPKLDKPQFKTSYVWEYAKANMSKMLAIKAYACAYMDTHAYTNT